MAGGSVQMIVHYAGMPIWTQVGGPVAKPRPTDVPAVVDFPGAACCGIRSQPLLRRRRVLVLLSGLACVDVHLLVPVST